MKEQLQLLFQLIFSYCYCSPYLLQYISEWFTERVNDFTMFTRNTPISVIIRFAIAGSFS